MIFTLKNTTRRPIVIQLEHRVSGGAFKSRSETAVRVDHDASGNSQVRRVRLRHPPVLRIPAGGEAEVPASVMHDKEVQKRLKKQGRPPLKVVRKESQDEWSKRKASEQKAAAALAAKRQATAEQNAARLAKRAAARDAAVTERSQKITDAKAAKLKAAADKATADKAKATKSSSRARATASTDTTPAKSE